MLMEYDCRKRSVRTDVQIDLYAAEPGPLGVAGPEISASVRKLIDAKEIGYHPEHQVAAVDPGERLITFVNGISGEFDLLSYVPAHQAPRVDPRG